VDILRTGQAQERRLIWQIDNLTKVAAQTFPLRIYSSQPIAQDQGREVDPVSLQGDLRQGDVFPPGPLMCSPPQIIAEYQAAHYLQAIALTICWGGMERTKTLYIYRNRPPQHIYNTIAKCVQSIQKTNSIQHSWNLLTVGLLWTPVMTSKILHFLCRALGFNQDPPVPIDNKVIRQYVWPGFRIGIPPGQRPLDWKGNKAETFAAYCRYMTAMIEWAQARQWTTTEVETTIYDENK
jgi:hypothetical protein